LQWSDFVQNAMLHHYADVNGVQLHYVAVGSGKLILFLHGFPEFWCACKRQLAEFGRGFQAVAPDLHLTIRGVPDASHWIVHEQPALVNRMIRDFVEECR
jgi:pimeloyl-ACP methyl ester carboxylesterase